MNFPVNHRQAPDWKKGGAGWLPWKFWWLAALLLTFLGTVCGPAAASPQDSEAEKELAAQVKPIMQRADQAFQNQQFQEAIKAYRQALKLKPELPEAHYGVGLAQARLGRYPDALAAFDQAVRFQPTWAKAQKDRGVTLLKLKRWADAAAAFRTAIRHHPEDPETHYNLGVAEGRLEHHREAQEAFAQAVRLKPDFVQAWNNLGMAYVKLERWPEARKAFEEALRLKTDSPEAHLGLLACHIQQGDGKAVAQEYETLKKLDAGWARKAAELLGQGK